MLKLSDLAIRPDFTAGDLFISPSRRIVRGPAGEANVEPLIMQVFLLLLDAQGRVVTRNEIFDNCWGGVMVGDDSVNRAIAGVRRIASQTAPGSFAVETIPRTGYRLDWLSEPKKRTTLDGGGRSRVSRRLVVQGGAAAAMLAAAGYWATVERVDPRAAASIDKGRQAMRSAMRGGDRLAAEHFRAATRIEPGNAIAWGMLALALRNIAEQSPPAEVSKAVMETEAAASNALAIDPKEPNARTALATVRPEFGNWAATEDALRAILADAPENVPALTYLVMILQSVGRARESWDLNERTLALDPLSPIHQFRRGLKLWILGRVAEADIAIDRALQLWPDHPGVWNARLMIFAFTGRAHAALEALNDRESRPADFPESLLNLWSVSLRALETRTPGDIAAARQMNLENAPTSPAMAVAAMLILSALEEVDAAFDVAEGTLLRRGPLIGTISAGKQGLAITNQFWRRTMNLFTPATASMRSHRRFRDLCEGMGMLAYWQKRGIWPDPMYRLNFG